MNCTKALLLLITINLIPTIIQAKLLSKNDTIVILTVAQSLMYKRIALISANISTTSIARTIRKASECGKYTDCIIPGSLHTEITEKSPPHSTLLVTTVSQFEKSFLVAKVRSDTLAFAWPKKARSHLTVRDKYGWLLFMDENGPFPTQIIPFYVEVIIIEKQQNNYYLWEQYNSRGGMTRKLIGFWEVKNDSMVMTKENVKLRRDIEDVPVFVLRHEKSSEVAALTSIEDTIDYLRQKLRFRVVNYFNGSANYDMNDVPMGYHGIIPGIEKTIGPLNKLKVYMYVQPREESEVANFIKRPFHELLWLTLFGWMILAAVCLAVTRKLYNFGKNAVIESTFTVIEAFCTQDGGESQPNERKVNIMIWLTVSFVIPAYSALLTSFFTVRLPVVPFNNLQEMVDDGSFVYGSITDSYQSKLAFLQPPGSLIRRAADNFMVPLDQMPNDYMQAMNFICRDNHFVFLSSADALSSLSAPCLFLRAREPFFSMWTTILSTPFMPFLGKFREVLPLLHSSGVLNRQQRSFEGIPFHLVSDEIPEIDLELVYPVFLTIPVGLILSMIIFSLEIISSTRRKIWTSLRLLFHL